MDLAQKGFLAAKFSSFEDCFSTAKRVSLTHHDLEFFEDANFAVPLNPQHEAASLALVLKKLSIHGPPSKSPFWTDYRDSLTKSNEVYKDLCPFQESSLVIVEDPDSPEEKLKNWIVTNGGCCDLSVAKITVGDCQVRGLVSSTDLDPGSCPLSVPEWLLINDQTAADSDLGLALRAYGVPKGDLLTVLWTMIDGHDDKSTNKVFWDTIPKKYPAASCLPCLLSLSFSKEEVDYLKDTPAGLELKRDQEHLQQTYKTIEPLLKSLQKPFSDFKTDYIFSYANFLWATQIWYAYGKQVDMSDEELCRCLVPFANMNHSPWPNCVQCGCINQESSSLQFLLFQECKTHEQVLLSYGPLPNQKLLIYFGFVLQNNPFEYISFESEIREELDAMAPSKRLQCLKSLAEFDLHLDQKMMPGTIPKTLILCTKILAAFSRDQERDVKDENIQQDSYSEEEEAYLKINNWLESMKSKVLANDVRILENDNGASELCKNYLKTQMDALKTCLQRLKS